MKGSMESHQPCECPTTAMPYARFMCFWVDGRWAVRTNIVVLEGRVSEDDEVTLGVGQDVMGLEEKPN